MCETRNVGTRLTRAGAKAVAGWAERGHKRSHQNLAENNLETAKAFANSPGHKEHESQVTALTKKPLKHHKKGSTGAAFRIIPA